MKVIDFENGHCKRVRSYLDSYLSNELMAETNLEVLRHLESCESCSRALDDRARIKAQLKQVVLNVQAPDTLHRRIRSDIRRTHGFNLNFNQSWIWAAAAAVVLAVMLGVFFRSGTNPSPSSHRELSRLAVVDPGDVEGQILKIGFDDHVYCAIDHGMANGRFTREEMSANLGHQYDGLVELVKERIPRGIEVVVGHRCYYQNREFVHLIMRRQEEVVSLIITQKNGETFPSAGEANLLNAGGIYVHEASWHGLHVVGFDSGNYLAFVISNETMSDSQQIASGLTPAVGDFLKKITV